MNLTYATLAASLKYPNSGKIDKSLLNLKKRGVFQSEKDYLEEIASKCKLKFGKLTFKRHPLSFLMEAADSICYRVMDIEDGYNKGWYRMSDLREFFKENRTISGIISNTENMIPEKKRMVNLRIKLIQYFVDLTIENFELNYDNIIKGFYNKELIEDDFNEVDSALGSFIEKHIFSQRDIQSLELTGDTVLKGLLKKYTTLLFSKRPEYRNRGLSLISNSIKKIALLEQKKEGFNDLSDYYKLRVIVDFISGMTDNFALNHYQKLNGQKV